MAGILFLEIDTEREWTVASIGPALIAAYVRAHGHEAWFMRVPPKTNAMDLVPQILKYSPDIIGISLTTRQWLRAAEVVRDIRGEIDIPIIAGGLHPTFEPETVLNSAGFDMVCLGEGEIAVCEILDILEMKEKVRSDQVHNIWLKGGQRPHISPSIRELDKLPFMSRDLMDEKHGVVHIVTRRGCPFKCSYCGARTMAELYEVYGAQRSIENVIQELEMVRKSSDLNYIIFLDDTFTLDSGWVEEFCKVFQERIGIGFTIHARVDTVNAVMIENLARAGCRHIVYGVESGSYRVRNKIMNRPVTDEAIKEAFRMTKEVGILTTANYMLGLPGETIGEIEMTLSINEEIQPDDFGYFVFYPYPGTRLFQVCKEKGYLPSNYRELPASHNKSVLNMPGLNHEEIAEYFARFTNARQRAYMKRYGHDMDEGGRRTVIEAFEKNAEMG